MKIRINFQTDQQNRYIDRFPVFKLPNRSVQKNYRTKLVMELDRKWRWRLKTTNGKGGRLDSASPLMTSH